MAVTPIRRTCFWLWRSAVESGSLKELWGLLWQNKAATKRSDATSSSECSDSISSRISSDLPIVVSYKAFVHLCSHSLRWNYGFVDRRKNNLCRRSKSSLPVTEDFRSCFVLFCASVCFCCFFCCCYIVISEYTYMYLRPARIRPWSVQIIPIGGNLDKKELLGRFKVQLVPQSVNFFFPDDEIPPGYYQICWVVMWLNIILKVIRYSTVCSSHILLFGAIWLFLSLVGGSWFTSLHDHVI